MSDRFTHGFKGERHKGFRIGTLWSSHHDAEGDVTMVEDFDEMTLDARFDLLTDVIGLLELERDLIHAEMYPESVKRNGAA